LLGRPPVAPLKDGSGKTIAYFDGLLREPGILALVGGSAVKAETTVA